MTPGDIVRHTDEELKIGSMVKLGRLVGKVIAKRDSHVLVEFENGEKFCLGAAGLKEYAPPKIEAGEAREQLKLF